MRSARATAFCLLVATMIFSSLGGPVAIFCLPRVAATICSERATVGLRRATAIFCARQEQLRFLCLLRERLPVFCLLGATATALFCAQQGQLQFFTRCESNCYILFCLLREQLESMLRKQLQPLLAESTWDQLLATLCGGDCNLLLAKSDYFDHLLVESDTLCLANATVIFAPCEYRYSACCKSNPNLRCKSNGDHLIAKRGATGCSPRASVLFCAHQKQLQYCCSLMAAKATSIFAARATVMFA
jgi:hypothetical protein